MRNQRVTLGTFLALLCLPAAPLAAQTYEVGVFGGLGRFGGNDLGSLSIDRPQMGETRFGASQTPYGVRATWNTPGYYGHEFGYTRDRPTLNWTLLEEGGVRTPQRDRVNVDQYSYNFLMYFMPSEARWRPYFTGGAHYQRFGVPTMWNEFGRNPSKKIGVNYGGGFKLKPHKNLLLRFDFRDNLSGAPYGLSFPQDLGRGGLRSAGIFRRLELTGGVSIAF
ncbi:MAG: outer membrane beta-barrel protein [Bryobacteraceae bacterium]